MRICAPLVLFASALPRLLGAVAGVVRDDNVTSSSRRSLIMVEGAQAADSDDLDPDDVCHRCLTAPR